MDNVINRIQSSSKKNKHSINDKEERKKTGPNIIIQNNFKIQSQKDPFDGNVNINISIFEQKSDKK